jgi:hypothetical protein
VGPNYERMNNFIKVDNGMFVPSNIIVENGPTASSQIKSKCICVPSGMCHSHTLLGCPHNHYFNDERVWTCVKENETS